MKFHTLAADSHSSGNRFPTHPPLSRHTVAALRTNYRIMRRCGVSAQAARVLLSSTVHATLMDR